MITFGHRFFPMRSAVCFLVDGTLLFLSAAFSCLLATKFGGCAPIGVDSVAVGGFLFASLCLLNMYMLDLYDLRIEMSLKETGLAVLMAVSVGGVSWYFLYTRNSVQAEVNCISSAMAFVILMSWRFVFKLYLTHYLHDHVVLIMGSGKIAIELEKELIKRKNDGLRMVGYIDDFPDPALVDRHLVPNLGVLADIYYLANKYAISDVIVALTERRNIYPVGALLYLRTIGVKIIEWPKFFEKLSGRIPVTGLPPSYFIFQEGFQKSRFIMTMARGPSILASAMALVLLVPLLVLVALAIKIDSPGPIFYAQERVGQNGKPFRILKFRSMREDAEVGNKAVWATQDDPRITRLGRFLRKTRIDELPQLINVLRGDLNIVGPRPERPEFVEKLEKLIPYYSIRHTVKPGVTGWAQVTFKYCGTVEESLSKLEYDLFYIKNTSLRLDLMILVKTVKIVLLGRGAR